MQCSFIILAIMVHFSASQTVSLLPQKYKGSVHQVTATFLSIQDTTVTPEAFTARVAVTNTVTSQPPLIPPSL